MGHVSIALVPFWRLDAKGGEVVLFRLLLRDLQGGHKHYRTLYLRLVCLCHVS